MISFPIIVHRSLLLCHVSCDKLSCCWTLQDNSNASNESLKPNISSGLCKQASDVKVFRVTGEGCQESGLAIKSN